MAKVRKILVDADVLVALAKPDDSNHKKALTLAKKLKNDILFITPFTIPEAATVLSYRVSHEAAKAFLSEARKRNLVELALNSEAIKSADEIFLAQKRKGTSWIDCLNAAMVKINFLDGIFSFDKFYSRLGIKLIK
ncbi:MAG: type II toxin-antitoxin system VapC family toxin [Microgenomates group bacterium]